VVQATAARSGGRLWMHLSLELMRSSRAEPQLRRHPQRNRWFERGARASEPPSDAFEDFNVPANKYLLQPSLSLRWPASRRDSGV
jgi:hypothetical protein